MCPPGPKLFTHSTSFRHRHLPATTFPSPKANLNQTSLDNSNRPTTTSIPSSNPRAPSHTTPIANATHASPHTRAARPHPTRAGALQDASPLSLKDPAKEGRGKETSNNEPPTANRPTRPDPIRSIRSAGFLLLAPRPPEARHRATTTTTTTFPRARHGTPPPTPVRASGSRLGWRDGRDASCRSRAFARGEGGRGSRRYYTARKMEPTHTRPVLSACFPTSAVVVVVPVS